MFCTNKVIPTEEVAENLLYLCTLRNVFLKTLRKLDKLKTKEEVAGIKNISTVDEQDLKVMSFRNRKKSCKDKTQNVGDASPPQFIHQLFLEASSEWPPWKGGCIETIF